MATPAVKKQIKETLIQRLLNRKDLTNPDVHDDQNVIWKYPATITENQFLANRQAWFSSLIQDGHAALRAPIPNDPNHVTNPTNHHAEAPPNGTIVGIYSDIKAAAKNAGEESLFIDAYGAMRDYLDKLDLHARTHRREAVEKAFHDGYDQGYNDCAGGLASDWQTRWNVYENTLAPSAHHTY